MLPSFFFTKNIAKLSSTGAALRRLRGGSNGGARFTDRGATATIFDGALCREQGCEIKLRDLLNVRLRLTHSALLVCMLVQLGRQPSAMGAEVCTKHEEKGPSQNHEQQWLPAPPF
jgi:hypothetical protein